MSSVISEIPVAILAGGLATRLRPLTETIPKIMIPVAGRPFLEHQIELLKKQGIRRVVLCLGHLGHMVEQQYGEGNALGIHLDYSYDGAVLLGTGGAIMRALPILGQRFLVTYGDSYLTTPFLPILEHFEHSGRKGLMTVYRNEGLYDISNVVYADGEIKTYDKKVHHPEMRHIDYGLSMFRSEVFSGYPIDHSFDLADVMSRLVRDRNLSGFEVPERFYEIGSHSGLAELENILNIL